MRKEIIALLLFCFTTTAGAGSIYKWVDENGVTHFGSEPKSGDASRVRLQGLNSVNGTPTAKHKTGRTTEPKPAPEIVMYGASWCAICARARNYFKANGVQYTEYDIEKNPSAKSEYDRLNGSGVPLFQVGGKTVRGFSMSRFDRLLALR